MVEFDEILVPVDGSEPSHRAARFAARLANATGCPLKLAHVVPMTPESVMGLAKLSRQEIEEAHRGQAAAVVKAARDAIGSAGTAAGDVQLLGDPAEEIVRYIEEHPKTMVVMGRRGFSNIRSLVLGSVSDKVVRHAVGAVTLVN